MTIGAGLVLVGCGDDDDDSKDGGEHGEHDHDGGGGSGGSKAGAGGSKAGTGGSKAGSGGSGGRAGTGGSAGGGDDDDAGVPLDVAKLSFFVTSDTSKTGNLGGLKGADERCNKLAKAAGSSKTFAAYLSAEKNEKGEDATVNARDRIGQGPWYNAKGVMLAKDVDALHALPGGSADLFLTEKGTKINGQWEGSPTPNEHDVLTGSTADGKLLENKTCKAWTSEAMADVAQVGHSDGLGPMRNGAAPYNSWNSSHENAGCNDTAPRGGAGHIYCFAK